MSESEYNDVCGLPNVSELCTDALLSVLEDRLRYDDAYPRIIRFFARVSSLESLELQLRRALEAGSVGGALAIVTAFPDKCGALIDALLRNRSTTAVEVMNALATTEHQGVVVPLKSLVDAVDEVRRRIVVDGEPVKHLAGPTLALARWISVERLAERVILPDIPDQVEYDDGGSVGGSFGFEECSLAEFLSDSYVEDPGHYGYSEGSGHLHINQRERPIQKMIEMLLAVVALLDDDTNLLTATFFEDHEDDIEDCGRYRFMPSWSFPHNWQVCEERDATEVETVCDETFRNIVDDGTDSSRSILYESLCGSTRTFMNVAREDGFSNSDALNEIKKNERFLKDFIKRGERESIDKNRRMLLMRVYALLYLSRHV